MIPFGNPMIGHSGGSKIDDVFATKLGSGQGNDIPLRFVPDMVWQKSRNISEDNFLFTTQRGQNKSLRTNTTGAEGTTTGSVLYGPDGVSRSTGKLLVTSSPVVWSFKQAERFFKIVVYTGDGTTNRAIPHGLKIKPGLVIIKQLGPTAGNWSVWSNGLESISPNAGITLNTTTAYFDNNTIFRASPDAQNFYIGGSAAVNSTTGTFIAYVFANDENPNGLIRCGSYTGINNAVGPFVNLGWEPQLLLTRNASQTQPWGILDNKRSTANPRQTFLFPNASDAESSNIGSAGNIASVDFLSNGFQPKSTQPAVNQNGQIHIYMAIRKGLV